MDMAVMIACQSGTTAQLEDLIPFQGELKSLSDENYAKLKTEILDTGFAFAPHVWRDQENDVLYLVDGHQRVEVLRRLRSEGYTVPPVPVVKVHAKTMKEAKRRILQAISQYGEMTDKSLAGFMLDSGFALDEIKVAFDFPSINMKRFDDIFKSVQIGREIAVSGHSRTIGLTDEDAVPDAGHTEIKLGDLYALGDHKLLCGDATDQCALDLLMLDAKADMVFTDPPYGMGVVKKHGMLHGVGIKGACESGVYRPVIGDDSTRTAITAFNLCMGLDIPILVFWGANFYAEALPPSSGWICWDKDNGEGFFADGELAWTNTDRQLRIYRHQWKGMIKASERGEKRIHPTQKPIALAEWCFDKYDKDGHSVLDLFGGSGSTLIACEKSNRKCLMMEIDPQYCQVIINRWEQFTGRKAEKLAGA